MASGMNHVPSAGPSSSGSIYPAKRSANRSMPPKRRRRDDISPSGDEEQQLEEEEETGRSPKRHQLSASRSPALLHTHVPDDGDENGDENGHAGGSRRENGTDNPDIDNTDNTGVSEKGKGRATPPAREDRTRLEGGSDGDGNEDGNSDGSGSGSGEGDGNGNGNGNSCDREGEPGGGDKENENGARDFQGES